MGVTLYVMVVGQLPIYNPDLMGFFDDLESKEIEYPNFLSPSLIYPIIFSYFDSLISVIY